MKKNNSDDDDDDHHNDRYPTFIPVNMTHFHSIIQKKNGEQDPRSNTMYQSKRDAKQSTYNNNARANTNVNPEEIFYP